MPRREVILCRLLEFLGLDAQRTHQQVAVAVQREAGRLELLLGRGLGLGEFFEGPGLVEGVGVLEGGEGGLKGAEDRVVIDAHLLGLIDHVG